MISVGIDVSKGKSTVCIMKFGGEILAPIFEMQHTMDGVLSLANRIEAYDEEVRVILEDTGYYHLPVVTVLVEKGVFVSAVNALRMKRFCDQSLRRAKTDRIDSMRIAAFGLAYWSELTPVMAQKDTYHELKLLARQYYQTTSIFIKAKINFGNLCDQVMPGVQDIVSDSAGRHKLTDFVERYRHFAHILEMGEKRFKADYCKWAQKQGYRFCERTAEKIYAAAQNGIPVLPDTPSATIAVTEAVQVLHQIETSRNSILTQMQSLAKTLPEYKAVREMSCIGDTLAPRLIAEIGDIRRFHSKHSLIAYAGIDAPTYQSGSFNAAGRHISKRGNKYLRKTGFEVMQSLVMHKPEGEPVFDFIEKSAKRANAARKR